MKVGDRVRVIKSVIVYHHPENKGKPFDVKDREGEVIGFANELHGKPISANLPVVIQFEKKFRGHFREDEIEIIE